MAGRNSSSSSAAAASSSSSSSSASFAVKDKTRSFLLPVSWLQVQKKNAVDLDLDLKLMSRRFQSFKDPLKDLANSFDKEWENFRKTSLFLGALNNPENLLRSFKENRNLTEISTQAENFATKSFKPSFSHKPHPNSYIDANKRVKEVTFWKPPPPNFDLASVRKALVPKLDDRHRIEAPDNGSGVQVKFPVDWKEMKLALRDWQDLKTQSKKKTYPVEEWEPLRRLRVSLVELETTAAASSSPAEFFNNLKKTEFFENTKRNLGQNVNDVTPLDVPELLENLVKQSQPLLDQLGVCKGFSEKVCVMLRSLKHIDQTLSLSAGLGNNMLAVTKEARKAADELDLRIASVLGKTGYKCGFWGEHGYSEDVYSGGNRNIAIITTASLPWLTGTAINPLFRAAYLAKKGKQNVTLLVPWLCKKDQQLVYPNQLSFDSPREQEIYIRDWLEARVNFKPDFEIIFYPGKFAKEKRSILAVGDITQFIPDCKADIAILEEPEHLTWYHHGTRWTRKFQHVVGVVHTNYLEYVKREKNGALQAFLLKYVNNWVTNVYCHKVVRLSAATQSLPKSIICNVHGVSPKFLDIGQMTAAEGEKRDPTFSKKAYYLGKMVWGKGYRELVDLLSKHKEDIQGLRLDVFGNGEDSQAVKFESNKLELPINFYEARDHADPSIHGYKVFINPSISDVVCTTTAEALAMGKLVVCADHPSNEFFKPFSNCLMYKNSQEFMEKVKQAMILVPTTLTPEERHRLSWEAATDRFIDSADLKKIFSNDSTSRTSGTAAKKVVSSQLSAPTIGGLVDNGLFLAHYFLSGIEAARLASGAIPGTMHMDAEQRRDLGLTSPLVQRTMYCSY